jgi:chromosome segregation ATPase
MNNKIIWSLLILLISFAACSKSSKNNVSRQPNLSSTPLVISDIHTIVDKDLEPMSEDLVAANFTINLQEKEIERLMNENRKFGDVEDLKDQLATAKRDLASAGDGIEDANRTIFALEETLKDKFIEIKSLNEQLDSIKATISLPSSQIIDENCQLKEQLERLQKEKEDLEANYNKRMREQEEIYTKDFQDATGKMDTIIKEQAARITQLSAYLADQSKTIEYNVATIKMQQERIASLQTGIALPPQDPNRNLDAAKTIDTQVQRIADLEHQIELLQMS